MNKDGFYKKATEIIADKKQQMLLISRDSTGTHILPNCGNIDMLGLLKYTETLILEEIKRNQNTYLDAKDSIKELPHD